MRYFVEISAIYRKDKARYSTKIVCITFVQYCILLRYWQLYPQEQHPGETRQEMIMPHYREKWNSEDCPTSTSWEHLKKTQTKHRHKRTNIHRRNPNAWKSKTEMKALITSHLYILLASPHTSAHSLRKHLIPMREYFPANSTVKCRKICLSSKS